MEFKLQRKSDTEISEVGGKFSGVEGLEFIKVFVGF